MVTVFYRLLHAVSIRMSDFAEWLHDRGGALECWCDGKLYDHAMRKVFADWEQWGRDNPMIDDELKRMSEMWSDYAAPQELKSLDDYPVPPVQLNPKRVGG